mgnify:CR=1 FL=1
MSENLSGCRKFVQCHFRCFCMDESKTSELVFYVASRKYHKLGTKIFLDDGLPRNDRFLKFFSHLQSYRFLITLPLLINPPCFTPFWDPSDTEPWGTCASSRGGYGATRRKLGAAGHTNQYLQHTGYQNTADC